MKEGKGKKFLLDLLCDLGGGFLFAMGFYSFAEMANFSPGGITGLALIFQHLWHVPMGLATLIMNIPLIIISWRVVGRDFILKTARTLIISTIFLDVIFPHTVPYQGMPLLAAFYAGLCIGAGMALFYMRGSSSGGMDFLIMTIKVRHPHFSFGVVTIASDLLVILLGGLVFKNIDAVLYGLICSFTCSIVMDKILYGLGAGKLLVIITTKGREVSAKIDQMTGRGSTIAKGIGSYTRKERDVILCACSRSQTYQVTEAAREVDPGAFIMITETSEVFGEGFIEKSM